MHLNFDMKKIIIVTGGAGFIGSNLISLLVKKTKFKILSETYISDGRGHDQLCLNKKNKLFMNGPAVFEFTKQIVPLAVKKLLRESKLNIKDIHSFYFHQASKFVFEYLTRRLSYHYYIQYLIGF